MNDQTTPLTTVQRLRSLRMNLISGIGKEPLSEGELEEVRQYAKGIIGFWKKRSLYSGVAFFLSCASVVPFLYGFALHAQWNSIGKYLLLLSMALLPVFVYCAAMLWSAWDALREVTKA
jgi:hypothetical protein